jgi:D-amino-acid dehydrogenase
MSVSAPSILASSASTAPVAVIGAGITGITTAYQLLMAGCAVVVFDRHPYAAMETSFANGGQLSASNAEVWTHPSTVLKGLKWMLRADAPLLVNPKPSWHKYTWFAEFLAALPRYRRNTVETARLAIAARQHLLDMAEAEGIDFNLERRGIMHIYRDRASYEHAAKVSVLLQEGGLAREALGPDDIRRIEPTVQGTYYGGFFTPSDFTGDIHRYTAGLAKAVERRGGVIRYDAAIDALRLLDGGGAAIGWSSTLTGERRAEPFSKVVICAGVGARRLAALAGDRVNVYPVKGYSITVMLNDEASQSAAPWVSLLDDATKIVTSRLGAERFRIAGTAEYNGENKDIRADRIRPLTDWCRRLFPGVSVEHVIPWAGLRPMMPDMMPRVQRGQHPGIFYNTGHGHLGWTLSAATAHMIAVMVTEDMARKR